MANPIKSMLHIDSALTDVSTAYIQAQENFVHDKVFPMLGVKKQSDKYYNYDKGDWLRIEAGPRAPGTETRGGGFKMSNSSYYCDVGGIHMDISEQDVANADDPIELETDATEWCTQQILLRRESDFLNTFFKTSVWAQDYTPSTLWSAANSTPLEDIYGRITALVSRTGQAKRDFTFLMAPNVWDILKTHPEVVARVEGMGSTQAPASVLLDKFAGLLEIKQCLVASAIYNSAVEGATDSLGFMATANDALLTYAPATPSLKKPSAGYIFNWTGLTGAGSKGTRMKKYDLEQYSVRRIEGEYAYDMHVTSTNAGIFFNNVAS